MCVCVAKRKRKQTFAKEEEDNHNSIKKTEKMATNLKKEKRVTQIQSNLTLADLKNKIEIETVTRNTTTFYVDN